VKDLPDAHVPSQGAVEEIAFDSGSNALLGKAADAKRPLRSKRRERNREMTITGLL
jgi:hypothetical protein